MHLEGAHPCRYQVSRQPDTMMLFVLRELFSGGFREAMCQRFNVDIFDSEQFNQKIAELSVSDRFESIDYEIRPVDENSIRLIYIFYNHL